MMNKGAGGDRGALAVRPARRERIEVVIHPQSIIHSMVEYRDGSVVAQLGTPDMRVPIAYGLAWPERIESGAKALDFDGAGGHELRAARPRALSLPAAGLGGAARAGRQRRGGAERRQRGRGRPLPGRRGIRFDQIRRSTLPLSRRPSRRGAAADSLDDLLRRWTRARAAARRAVLAQAACPHASSPSLPSSSPSGVLIVVHEYGHYRVAVACGVKVLRFSVGFGSAVAGSRRSAATRPSS